MDAEAASAFLQAAEKSGAPSEIMTKLKKAQQESGLRGVCEIWLRGLIDEKLETEDLLVTAALYGCTGNKDRELVTLARALDERSFGIVWLGVDPNWDRLRSDKRFQELLRRLHWR
jgi:hypothetical protein